MDLTHCSATQLAASIAHRNCTAVEVAQACLSRIEQREPDVQAWAHIDRQLVLAQARERDHEQPRGPLHGVPVGIKDIIDTYDMPSEYGSAIYAGHRPKADAACVALLRAAGAVIMGKTVTVELAAFHWARTRNPHNLAHTPGGSSSGSAAAVADFMVPLAVGTQTGGSTIRPAAFCGIVGYKPSFNLINRAGVKPLAESQDTVGFLGREIADVALMFSLLSGAPAPDFKNRVTPPRIGLCQMAEWPALQPAMARAMNDSVAKLARKGAKLQEITLSQPFSVAFKAQKTINLYESWRALSYERQHHATLLSSTLSDRLREAASCTFDEYLEALAVAAKCRLALDQLFADYDVLLTPSVTGEAPEGLTNTGDSSFIRIWTTFHTPTVNLPAFQGPNGLPMGIQVIGPFQQDRQTLGFADWIYRALTA